MVEVPVVIVGGGPVGMSLAMNLAAFGVTCLIANAEPQSRTHPAGSTQNARTMEHYRRLGISSELRRLGLPPDHPTDVGYFTTLNGWELARIPMPSERQKMADVASARPTDQTPEPLLRCNQLYVEQYLFQHIRTLPTVDVRFGWRCADIDDGEEQVGIVIENVETGERESVACNYLVGCDGARSTVRRHLEIAYAGDVPEEQSYGSGAMVSTHLRAPGIYKAFRHAPCWTHAAVNHTVRSNIITLNGKGEFLINSKLRNPNDKPDQQLIADLIFKSIGEKVDIEFLGHRPWTAGHALVADRFGKGRIVIAGDAAHVFTPTGGFGMNTGVDDAANLGWKLAALVAGWGGPGLLASYEAERRPIAFRNTGMAKYFARSVGSVPITEALMEDSAAGNEARAALGEQLSGLTEEWASIGVQLGSRYDDSPIVVSDGTAPPADDPWTYHPTACPGGRAPHLFRSDRGSLYDDLGPGFTLLQFHGDHDTGLLAAAARSRGIPFKTVAVDEPVARELYECDLALIRPDQHVAWRGDRLPSDCDGLLARVTGWVT